MTNQQNTTLVKKYFEEVLSKGNLTALDQLVSNDVKLVDAAQAHFKGGLAGLKHVQAEYIRAFPNKSIKIDEIMSTDDNKVVARWTCSGTHKGELHEIGATGKGFKISGISIYHLSNGKITEIYQTWDRLGLLEQIGVIEPAEALH